MQYYQPHNYTFNMRNTHLGSFVGDVFVWNDPLLQKYMDEYNIKITHKDLAPGGYISLRGYLFTAGLEDIGYSEITNWSTHATLSAARKKQQLLKELKDNKINFGTAILNGSGRAVWNDVMLEVGFKRVAEFRNIIHNSHLTLYYYKKKGYKYKPKQVKLGAKQIFMPKVPFSIIFNSLRPTNAWITTSSHSCCGSSTRQVNPLFEGSVETIQREILNLARSTSSLLVNRVPANVFEPIMERCRELGIRWVKMGAHGIEPTYLVWNVTELTPESMYWNR